MTGLIWPFPARSSSMFRRVDQGWDLQAPVGTPILAVADGKIEYRHNALGFGDPYILLLLDSPINGNLGVYYGHNHSFLLEGTRVKQGEVIAYTVATPGGNAKNLPGWLEIGWWKQGPTGDGAAIKTALINAPIWTPTVAPTAPKEDDVPKDKDNVAACACWSPGCGGLFLLQYDGGVLSVGDHTADHFRGSYFSLPDTVRNDPNRRFIDIVTDVGLGYFLVANTGEYYGMLGS